MNAIYEWNTMVCLNELCQHLLGTKSRNAGYGMILKKFEGFFQTLYVPEVDHKS
jgi:hypothetical protein